MAFQVWNSDWFPLPGQAVFDHEHQQIAAVSRASGNLDLFVIGFDNHIWSTFWFESSRPSIDLGRLSLLQHTDAGDLGRHS